MLISKKLLRLQYFDILFSSSEDDVFEIKARYFFLMRKAMMLVFTIMTCCDDKNYSIQQMSFKERMGFNGNES